MAEYIDREALIEQVKAIHKAVDTSNINISYDTGFHSATSQIQGLIAWMPAADVAEVVRCKDCVFSRELDKYEKKLYLDNCVGCTQHSTSYFSLIMQDNDFCSYGEKKDGKENAE